MRDQISQPLIYIGTSLLKLIRIRLFWIVKLSTMTAIIAVADLAQLVELGSVSLLRGPLPWILATVGEKDICASSIKASLINGCLVCTRESAHIDAESVSTVLREIHGINDRATHGMFN